VEMQCGNDASVNVSKKTGDILSPPRTGNQPKVQADRCNPSPGLRLRVQECLNLEKRLNPGFDLSRQPPVQLHLFSVPDDVRFGKIRIDLGFTVIGNRTLCEQPPTRAQIRIQLRQMVLIPERFIRVQIKSGLAVTAGHNLI
jgi:hypothetical protein